MACHIRRLLNLVLIACMLVFGQRVRAAEILSKSGFYSLQVQTSDSNKIAFQLCNNETFVCQRFGDEDSYMISELTDYLSVLDQKRPSVFQTQLATIGIGFGALGVSGTVGILALIWTRKVELSPLIGSTGIGGALLSAAGFYRFFQVRAQSLQIAAQVKAIHTVLTGMYRSQILADKDFQSLIINLRLVLSKLPPAPNLTACPNAFQ